MKWLPPLFVGIVTGAALTFAMDLFLDDSPAITAVDLKALQDRAQAQAVEIGQQRQELAAKSTTIAQLQRAVAQSPAALTAKAAATPAKPQNPMAGLAAMMDTPAMKKMMAAQQERMIEDNYADLIAQFHFTPEERAQFVRLLSAKQAIDMEMGFKMMKLSPDERKNLIAESKAARDKADAAIREFFNDEKDFATYTDYTKQQTQNYAMKALRPAMKFAGEPLTPKQEKSLGEIMRTAGKSTPKTDESPEMPGDAEQNARILADQAQSQQRIAAEAARILSPAQLEVLKKSQASQLQMMKAGFEMSQSMFGE